MTYPISDASGRSTISAKTAGKTIQDLGLLKLSVLVQPVVLSIEAAEPATPALGDVHVLDEAHATHPNEIIVWDRATSGESLGLYRAEGRLEGLRACR